MPTGMNPNKLISISVLTLSGEPIMDMRLRARTKIRQVKACVQAGIKTTDESTPRYESHTHGLVYNDTVLNNHETLHSAKVKNGSFFIFIDMSEYDEDSDQMPPLVSSSSDSDNDLMPPLVSAKSFQKRVGRLGRFKYGEDRKAWPEIGCKAKFVPWKKGFSRVVEI